MTKLADYSDIYEEFTGKKMPGNNDMLDKPPIDDFRKFVRESLMNPFTTEFREIIGGRLELSLNAEFNSPLFSLEKVDTINQNLQSVFVTISSKKTGTIAAFNVLSRNHREVTVYKSQPLTLSPVLIDDTLIVTAQAHDNQNLPIPVQIQVSGRYGSRKRKSVGF